MQNDNGVRETIGEAEVATVVAQMSGIPVQKISESEEGMLRHLSDTLKSSVISQDKAIDKISRCIQRSRLGLKDPNKPIGVFMSLTYGCRQDLPCPEAGRDDVRHKGRSCPHRHE